MREIKFRAWDGEKMCYPRFFEFGVCGVNGKTSIAFERRGGMCTTAYIMQYIGYADINKVDIYEGDILKDCYNRILLVLWRKGGFCVRALTKTNFKYALDLSEWFEFDMEHPLILGNMYENPDLIKED